MRPRSQRLSERRAVLRLAPAALLGPLLSAQVGIPVGGPPPADSAETTRLPNGKNRQDELAKADYNQNLKEARDLVDLARAFERDLEKDDRFVVSLTSLRKLDEIERLAKRIRGRLKGS